METDMKTTLKEAVAQYHNADPEEVQTLGDAFDSLKTFVEADACRTDGWAIYYNETDRTCCYGEVYLNPDTEDEVWVNSAEASVEDFLVLDTDAIERVGSSEATSFELGLIEALAHDLGVTDDLPVEFVGVREDLASLHGIDNEDIIGVESFQDAINRTTMRIEGTLERNTIEVADREGYDACETLEFALDRYIHRHVPRTVLEEHPVLYNPEHYGLDY